MRPSQVAASLRQIASRIDRSHQPDKVLVAQALRRLLASLHVSSQTVKLLMNDGSYVDHDPSLPAPDGYALGADPHYPQTITEVALKRAAMELTGGKDSAEVLLPPEDGYGSMVDNCDDLILLGKESYGQYKVWMGPKEQEMDEVASGTLQSIILPVSIEIANNS